MPQQNRVTPGGFILMCLFFPVLIPFFAFMLVWKLLGVVLGVAFGQKPASG